MTPALPSNRADFLAHGLELAECSICREPFDNAHWPYQIRECGHTFGRVCLEAWLQQSDSRGTCPQCRSVLFEAFSASEIAELERERYELRDQALLGRDLRLLNVHDRDGFLVALWTEITNAFAPDVRETYENAWTPRIIGLIQYLLEGLGLPNHHHDRVVLSRAVRETNARELVLWDASDTPPFGYQPIYYLSRQMLKISRIFPRQVIPDPILWRAMICCYNLGGLEIAVCHFEDDRDWMFDPQYDASDRNDLAAMLYLFLVLMAQDSKHNLQPNDDYDAEDVESLLRVMITPVSHFDYQPSYNGKIS